MTKKTTFQASDYADVFDVCSQEPSASSLVLSYIQEAAETGDLNLLIQTVLYAADHGVLTSEQAERAMLYTAATVDLERYPIGTWMEIPQTDLNDDYRSYDIRIDDSRLLRQGVNELFGTLPKALTTKKQFKDILKFFLRETAYSASAVSATNYLRGERMEDVLELLKEPSFRSDLSDAVQDVIWRQEKFSARFIDNMAVLLLLKRRWPQTYQSIYDSTPRSEWKSLAWSAPDPEDHTALDLVTTLVAGQQARMFGTDPRLAVALYREEDPDSALLEEFTEEEYAQGCRDRNQLSWVVSCHNNQLDDVILKKGKTVLEACEADPNLQFDVMDQMSAGFALQDRMSDYLVFTGNERLALAACTYLKVYDDEDAQTFDVMTEDGPAAAAVLPASAALLRALGLGIHNNPDLLDWIMEQMEASSDPVVKQALASYARWAARPDQSDEFGLNNPLLQEEALEALLDEIFAHEERIHQARASFENRFPAWKDLPSATRQMMLYWVEDQDDQLAEQSGVQLLAYFLSEDWRFWVPGALIYRGYEGLLESYLSHFIEAFAPEGEVLDTLLDRNPELAQDPDFQYLVDLVHESQGSADEDWCDEIEFANEEEALIFKEAMKDFYQLVEEESLDIDEDSVFPLSFIQPENVALLHFYMEDPDALNRMSKEEKLSVPAASEKPEGGSARLGIPDSEGIRIWEAWFSRFKPGKLEKTAISIEEIVEKLVNRPYSLNSLDRMISAFNEAAALMGIQLRLSKDWVSAKSMSATLYREALWRIAYAYDWRYEDVLKDAGPAHTAAQKKARAQDMAWLLAELALNLWITKLAFENQAQMSDYDSMTQARKQKMMKDAREFVEQTSPHTDDEIRKAVDTLTSMLNKDWQPAISVGRESKELYAKKWESVCRRFMDEGISEEFALKSLPAAAMLLKYDGPVRIFDLRVMIAMTGVLEGNETWRWEDMIMHRDKPSEYDEFVD